MALYEFYCDSCKHKFEQITSSTDPDQGRCPKCSDKDKTRRLVSRFAVGGQGDLRETTQHGCHEHDYLSGAPHDHDHDHGHNHDGDHDH